MAIGSRKGLGLLAILGIALFTAPSGASAAQPAMSASVWTLHVRGASAATAINRLTLTDDLGIDNRISARVDAAGRLVLTAPEGLHDPDGDGVNCKVDNANPGQSFGQQVSCAPGYIGAIVGHLNGGNDTFDADAGLSIPVGSVLEDGRRKPLSGGPGRDRVVGGASADLLEGGGGPDSIVGGGEPDVLDGGPGADNLSGGAGSDVLLGLAGPDKLNGGGAQDLCKGGGGKDAGKSCELTRGIP
jgi:RTX calcium-binding nonapeptide repeat (4 copies)